MKFHYDDKIKDTKSHDEIHMLTLSDAYVHMIKDIEPQD